MEKGIPSSETLSHRAGSSTIRRGSPISRRQEFAFPPLSLADERKLQNYGECNICGVEITIFFSLLFFFL